MKKLLSAAFAAAALFCAGQASGAVVTGFFYPGIFVEEIPIGTPDGRPLRLEFTGDFSQVSGAAHVLVDVAFAGTVDGDPANFFADSFEIFLGPYALGPTGFTVVLDVDENPTCDPFSPPAYYCEHQTIQTLLLDGYNDGETVQWTLRTTVVPEPGAWALMILGFATAGAMARRQRTLRPAA